MQLIKSFNHGDQEAIDPNKTCFSTYNQILIKKNLRIIRILYIRKDNVIISIS